MPHMYILQCADGSFYTGSTKNLRLRLAQHQAGIGAKFTSKHLPVKLVYCEEYTRVDYAFYREKQVQRWSHAKKLALIKDDFLGLKKKAKKDFAKYRERRLSRYAEAATRQPVVTGEQATRLPDVKGEAATGQTDVVEGDVAQQTDMVE